MRVLITNDDGLHAPGIQALVRAAEVVFDDVWVVAPATEQSAVSQALSLRTPLRVDKHGPRRFSVAGTPADAVFLALGHIVKGRRPNLVLSGINMGPNVGWDIYYSGTVGGAREALIHGIPACALSLGGRPPYDFDTLSPLVKHLLETIREHGVPPEVLYNINIPRPRDNIDDVTVGVRGIRGIRGTRLGHRSYGNEVVHREDPRGRPYYWIGGAFPRMEEVAGTDCETVRQGYVSITPIGLDVTDHPLISGASAAFDPQDTP